MPERRREILALLRAAVAPVTVQDLAVQVGVHANTVRFHLDRLLRDGHVRIADEKAVGSGGPGRPSVRYRAVRRMDPGGPSNLGLLAAALADHLRTTTPDYASVATAIGRRLGADLTTPLPTTTDRAAAVVAINNVLDDLGFRSETIEAGSVVRLRHCPFLPLVGDTLRAVACPLHLGLMQGAFDRVGGGVGVERIVAFAEPDACLAYLTPPADATAEASR